MKFNGEANFTSAKFAGHVFFSDVTIAKAAYFLRAEFTTGASIGPCVFTEGADFSNARFMGEADFTSCDFVGPAAFLWAEFRVGVKLHAHFAADAKFDYAIFGGDADFRGATFNNGLSLNQTVVKGYVAFSGEHTDWSRKDGTLIEARTLGRCFWLDFRHARIERPERVSFDTLSLRPHWFVNVDARKFVFSEVSWDETGTEKEVEALKGRAIHSPNELLTDTYRQLAENAELNNRYEQASKFRYSAMDHFASDKMAGLDVLED